MFRSNQYESGQLEIGSRYGDIVISPDETVNLRLNEYTFRKVEDISSGRQSDILYTKYAIICIPRKSNNPRYDFPTYTLVCSPTNYRYSASSSCVKLFENRLK